jgi:Transposase DDE domain
MDADTGQIAAAMLTTNDVDDASQIGPLLDQVGGRVASLTADGAYDQHGVYAQIAARHTRSPTVRRTCLCRGSRS